MITYNTSIRIDFEVPMAMVSIRFFHNQSINQKKQTVDLFIHSNGGDGTIPWRLVNLISRLYHGTRRSFFNLQSWRDSENSAFCIESF